MKKMILFIFLLNSILFSESLICRVYLTNRSIYIGELITLIPEESVTIRTFDENIINFKWNEIEKFEIAEDKIKRKEPKPTVTTVPSEEYYKKFQKLKLFFSYSLFSGNYPNNGTQLTLKLPFLKNPSGYVFVESGIIYDNVEFQLIPLYFGFKIFNAKASYSFFVSGKLGIYNADCENFINKWGPLVNLSIGMHATDFLFGFMQMNIGITHIHYHKHQYYNDWYYYDYGYEKVKDALKMLTIGLSFGF